MSVDKTSVKKQAILGACRWVRIFLLTFFVCFLIQRSAKLIPEDDQIFTEVELNTLEKVINETMVGTESLKVARCLYAV